MNPKFNAMLVAVLACVSFTSSVLYLLHVQKKLEPTSLTINHSLISYTKEELSGISDLIIEGNIKNISPGKWNTSDGKKPKELSIEDIIYREVDVNVKNVLKGTINGNAVIKVYTYEGIDEDGFVVRSNDEPKFKEGENVLLFLNNDRTVYNKLKSNDHYIVTGLIQGKYEIENDITKNEYSKDTMPLEDLRTLIKNNVNTKLSQPSPDAVLEK